MTPLLLNNWQENTVNEVFRDFCEYGEEVSERPEFKNVEILLASYGTPSYEGYAFVLFKRDGKLYEVNGSHCSCYGLEGQWNPEATSAKELLKRVDEGHLGAAGYGDNPFANELREVLISLDKND